MKKGPGIKVYLPIALAIALVATLGADISARTSIGSQSLDSAFWDHWTDLGLVANLFLFTPFVIIAVLGAVFQRQARTRTTAASFALTMAALVYFYFEGFVGAQQALLDERWTAAALSVGMLPIFIGCPAILLFFGLCAAAEKIGPRPQD